MSIDMYELARALLQELRLGQRTFDDFIQDGFIEYLDVNEMNDALIANYEREIGERTTHLEVTVEGRRGGRGGD